MNAVVTMSRRCLRAGVFHSSLLLLSSLVMFQPSFAAEQGRSGVIEEIVVTAQKREERLQETPVSVTAFSASDIEALGFRQSVDVTAQTPNFSVGYPNGDTGVPAPFIRGVGLNDFGVLNQGPIAAYSDETYISSNAAQIFQLLDVERVEVLRGPQGTLYGRNATGGAVNFVAHKPTTEWEGWVRGGTGSFGLTKFEGAGGGPISDTVRFRAAVLKTDSDGWLTNKFTGHDQNGMDELAWRVLLEADASDNLNLLLNVHGGKTESDSVQYRHLGVWDAGGNQCPLADIKAGLCADIFGYSEEAPYTTFNGVDLPAVPAYDEGNYNLETKNDTKFWGVSLTAEWDIGDLTVTSISSYDDMEDNRPEETDAGPNDILEGVLAVDQQTFSQELRLSGETGNVTWLAGVYYLSDEADDHTAFDILRDLRPLFIGDTVSCPSAPPGNPTGFCPEAFVQLQESGTHQEITSFSVFADATWDLSEAWDLSFGLRYTSEEVKQDVDFFFNEPAAGNPTILAGKDSIDFNDVSGRVVANYTLNDNVMFYGGITTGFKAGGIQSTTDGIFPYDEETLVSYEGGFKSTLADGAVRLNGAVFYYDYTDLQVFTFIIVDGTPFSVLDNAADAEVYGAELELQAIPIENLFVNLGVGLLHTEYKDFVTDLGDDFSGNNITMSPEKTLNGLVQYDIPLSDRGTLTVQADFSYQDKVFFDSINNELLSEDAYWLWNGRISWMSPGEQWEVAAWGRNLGDEEYKVYAFDLSFFGFNEEMIGTPRAYGLEVTYRP